MFLRHSTKKIFVILLRANNGRTTGEQPFAPTVDLVGVLGKINVVNLFDKFDEI
ncbi:MAG: hypothetical protein PUP90_00240 [Nostoc sp. S4]|nr:hypothetical protein [Nostoc sp. S4]